MSQALVSPADCCSPCAEAPITQITGPQGPASADGAAGADGINAFTETTDSFVMPLGGNVVQVEVVESTWAAIGQVVFVEGAGYFAVDNIPDATHLGLANLDYTGNAAPTTVIPSGEDVSPAGLQGIQGPAPPSSTLNDLSPTTTKGDLLVDNGANNPDASVVRLAAGTDGQIFTSQSSTGTGLLWQTLLPLASGSTDNVVPRFNTPLGTEEPSPVQTSGMLISDTGALQSTPTGGNARGASATDLQVTRANATEVASGTNSVLAGGANNTASAATSSILGGSNNLASGSSAAVLGGQDNIASGQRSLAGGGTCEASGDFTLALGLQNEANATNSTAIGGQLNLASGDFSTALGGLSNIASTDYSIALGSACTTALLGIYGFASGLQSSASNYGQRAHASGFFTAVGDAQVSQIVYRIATTDATANVEMFLDGVSERATLWNNGSWAFHIWTVARNMATGLSAVWETKGGMKRIVAGAVALIGTVDHALIADDGEGWMVAGAVLVDVDAANINLRIRVTGQAATDIRWVSYCRLAEIGDI